jgi:purine nucleosidase
VSFHDPLAAACVFNDSICRFTRGIVDVELQSQKLMGYTYFTRTDDGPHEVASDVDPEAFFDEYFSVFK